MATTGKISGGGYAISLLRNKPLFLTLIDVSHLAVVNTLSLIHTCKI